MVLGKDGNSNSVGVVLQDCYGSLDLDMDRELCNVIREYNTTGNCLIIRDIKFS